MDELELADCRWPTCDYRAVVEVYPEEGYCRHHALEVADREARIWAMERFRRVCQRCGAGATDVHHVITRQARYIRHDRRNLMPLCRHDHEWAHREPASWERWLEERVPGRLLELWATEAKGENRGGHVDLAGVIRGFREEGLSEEDWHAYRSGRWRSATV